MKEDLLRNPKHLYKKVSAKDAWYYEQSNGLSVVVEPLIGVSVIVVDIPISSIRAYLKRLDKGKESA